jgi:hypothetical protein
MPRTSRFKPRAARVHQHHDIVAHSVLNDYAHVAKTTALVVEKKTWLCAHSLGFCRLIDSLAWVLRSCNTLVLELATVAVILRHRVLRRSSYDM